MAKFLDKKEQVIDFQLTPYGKHRLSVGQFKPHSYAFFDTGVTYDVEYLGDKEIQTKIHERIKTETQFIEGVLLFEEAENSTPPAGSFTSAFATFSLSPADEMALFGTDAGELYTRMEIASAVPIFTPIPEMTMVSRDISLFDLDIVLQRYVPKPEKLSFESAIGDAKFEGDNTQASPAWKIVTCQGEMSNIKQKDTTNYNYTAASFDEELMEWNIPQIDVDAHYTLLVSKPTGLLGEETVSEFVSETAPFVDGNTIKLVRDDIVVYVEEFNTELLTENFDIQVFEMTEETELEREATGSILTSLLVVGETITIRDGKETVVFKIIDNTAAARAAAVSEFEESGTIGVVASSAYKLAGVAGKNRVGTIYNLMSAINGDNGTTDLGYPTDPHDGSNADGSRIAPTAALQRGRCKTIFGTTDDGADNFCYIGGHNLKVKIEKSTIEALQSHSFAGSATFSIDITNKRSMTDDPPVNPNILWEETGANTTVTGFSDGIAMAGIQLKQKYYKNENPQIVDGLMKTSNPESVPQPDLTTDAVDYYFSVLTDKEVNAKIACSCANTFNKNSYYVDIDFDCEDTQIKEIYYDIYGSATAPEICDVPSEQISTIEDLRLTDESEGCED
jgi:hypothetical protein